LMKSPSAEQSAMFASSASPSPESLRSGARERRVPVYLVGGFELIIRLRVARNSARPADWPFRASLRRWARAVSGSRSSPRLGVVIVFKAKRFRDEMQGSRRLSIGRRAHWADRSGGNEGCVLRPLSNRGTKESSTHFPCLQCRQGFYIGRAINELPCNGAIETRFAPNAAHCGKGVWHESRLAYPRNGSGAL
jgi:hypothetical protein